MHVYIYLRFNHSYIFIIRINYYSYIFIIRIFPPPGWISGVANTASLPCLLLSYVLGQFFPNAEAIDESVIEHYGLLVCFTLIFAYVNYRGLDVVSSLVMIIFFVSMTPFFLMVILGIPKGE